MPAGLNNSMLDALPSMVAILNERGVIVQVNRCWKEFADANALGMKEYGLGANYLDYCPAGLANGNRSEAFQGILETISGKRDLFEMEYTCHSPSEERWFELRAAPFEHEGCRYVLVQHENVTAGKLLEYRFSSFMQNSPIGMAVFSSDGRFMDANRVFKQLMGYSDAELLGICFERLTHPDDRLADQQKLRDLLDRKYASYSVEKRYIRKDGHTVWVALTCSIVFDELGRPTQIIKQIQDISERVKAETALRESEHRLNLVLDHMPALIGYWNKDLINEFGNKAYIEWFGYDSERIKGKHLREVIGEHLYHLNLPYVEKALRGETQLFERLIVDTLGKGHHTLASYIPDISAGEVKGFFVLVTDITQIKLTELELRKSEELSRILLSVSIDGFVFMDADGAILEANDAFCEMLGYGKDEILNLPMFGIEAQDKAGRTITLLDDIVAKGFDRFETGLQRKDGVCIAVEVSVAYLPDKNRFFSFIRDISQRKQSEEKRIRQLEQQRDALVREVHHRIKNHLQGMLGFLSLHSNAQMADKDFIHDISAKISSIAVVYGIQGKNNQDKAYLCEIMQEICQSLSFFGMKRNIINYVEESVYKTTLSPEYAVPLAIIVNELIVNAIKHNTDFPNKRIDVSLVVNETNALLQIANRCLETGDFPDMPRMAGLGVGLSLVHAMLPKQGAALSLTRSRGVALTSLTLEKPLISTELK